MISLINSRGIITFCRLPAALFNTFKPFFFLLCFPLLRIGMDDALTSRSLTLVNDTHHTERQSLKLRISGGASNILNSTVLVDTAGQPLYSILSDSKCTKMVSCRDNVEVATIQWDRHSPRMTFRRKKMKCKEWLKLAGPNNEYNPQLIM